MLLTKDGFVVGDGFALQQQDSQPSQLSLQSEKTELHDKLALLQKQLSDINEALTKALEQQNQIDDQLEHAKNELQQQGLTRSSLLSTIAALTEQHKKDEQRKQHIGDQLKSLEEKISAIHLDEAADIDKHKHLIRFSGAII